LKKMLGSYFGKWAKQLPVVQMALNNNISSTHGSVPASLLFNNLYQHGWITENLLRIRSLWK
jgi:hypothetical protein